MIIIIEAAVAVEAAGMVGASNGTAAPGTSTVAGNAGGIVASALALWLLVE
jgi:hypothetical protein